MKTSESIKKIATALNKAQSEMTGAVKDAQNPFFQSTYADLESVITAIKEPFLSNGLSWIQSPVYIDGCVGVVTRFMHTSGEWIEGEVVLPIAKPDPQSAGSAITYARRYALQSMAGIPALDDDGEAAMSRNQPDNKQVTEMVDLFIRSINEDNNGVVYGHWAAFDDQTKRNVWGLLTHDQRTKVKAMLEVGKPES